MSKVCVQVYCATCLAVLLVCDQYNTQKWKSGKKWERLENTYHVNDIRWMRDGRRGEILDFITTARRTPDVREIECARLDKNGGGLTTRL